VSPTNASDRRLIEEGAVERTVAPRRLPSHTLSDLLIPASGALDLSEGRAPGHGQRVAYIAMALAGSLGLEGQTRLACCYAALFHDVGAIAAGAGLAGLTHGDERLVFASIPPLSADEAALGVARATPHVVVDRIVDHVIHGARAAQELALPPEAIQGISTHHERWDGGGYPHGLSGEEIPIVGRVVGLADEGESMISQEASPLLARRNLQYWLNRLSGAQADPKIINAMRDLGSGDLFWLGLYSADLPSDLASQCSRIREPKAARLLPFAESFALLVDSRFSFTHGVSMKVASLCEALGRNLGLSELRLKQLRAAALFHDVGQLCVSERIISKPGILTVEELDVLRQHPLYSRDVVSGIVGLEEVADWVAAHHERPDGRGYPDGRKGEEIPLEARILAIADAYVAITSDRPHRERADQSESFRRLRTAAGSQLDGDLVEVFLNQVVAA
jgi:putative nucleotidyltransferase with HDIG domain